MPLRFPDKEQAQMQRFYWVIEDVLAGCSRPGGTGWQRPGADDGARPSGGRAALEEDLAWLRTQGIGAILSLTEQPLAEEALARSGLEWLHLPVDDLQAPTAEEFLHALDFLDAQQARGRPVAVHCLMGQGRSGTV